MRHFRTCLVAALTALISLGGCGADVDYSQREELPGRRGGYGQYGETNESIFGPGGLSLLGGEDEEPAP